MLIVLWTHLQLRKTVVSIKTTALFASIPFMVISGSVLADRIDGYWCSPSGSSISVDGTRVVTPGGKTLVAYYDRHNIHYVIPEGEVGAGDRFSASQLNEEQIRVVIVSRDSGKAGAAEIWTPCKQISSNNDDRSANLN